MYIYIYIYICIYNHSPLAKKKADKKQKKERVTYGFKSRHHPLNY